MTRCIGIDMLGGGVGISVEVSISAPNSPVVIGTVLSDWSVSCGFV